MAESGIADYVTTFWTGVIVPAGTPEASSTPQRRDRDGLKSDRCVTASRAGAEAAPGSPRDLPRSSQRKRKVGAIAKTAGLQPE